MTQVNITYKTYTLLSCRCEEDSAVIICLDSSLTADGAPFIEGTISSYSEGTDSCGRTLFSYYLQYDDADLADPATLLLQTQISGVVCKGCLTNFIEWRTRTPLKGASTSRPTAATGLYTGMMYMDTTLDADGLPIWWNGSKWIKADGSDA